MRKKRRLLLCFVRNSQSLNGELANFQSLFGLSFFFWFFVFDFSLQNFQCYGHIVCVCWTIVFFNSYSSMTMAISAHNIHSFNWFDNWNTFSLCNCILLWHVHLYLKWIRRVFFSFFYSTNELLLTDKIEWNNPISLYE